MGASSLTNMTPLRRRIGRRVNGTYTRRFLYADNINPVAELDAAGNTVSTFVYGTGINVPDYMIRGGPPTTLSATTWARSAL